MGVPIVYNLRNLVERKGTTFMTAFGIGLTVAVLVTAMALTAGLDRVFAGSGDPRQVIVMRQGVNAELTSTVSTEAYQIIRRLPGIARTGSRQPAVPEAAAAKDEQGASAKVADDEPMVSPEGLTVVNLPSVDSPDGMNVTVRGLLPVGVAMRPVEVTAGKMFTPGLRQITVGESIAKRYPDVRIGKQVRFGRGMWEVVGVFRVGESAANSEIWADLNQLRGDFERQGGSSSLLIRTENDAAMATLIKTIKDDQRLGSAAVSEKQYYADLTSSGTPIKSLGFSVAVIMAVGSAFAATNTMYAAVARRAREIGTLRAIGFGRGAILLSFMFESVFLALIGGVVGVLIALPVNGLTTGVGSFVTFSETAFKFHIGPISVLLGLLFAAGIGALGGFLPAWAASKKGIVAAMRDP